MKFVHGEVSRDVCCSVEAAALRAAGLVPVVTTEAGADCEMCRDDVLHDHAPPSVSVQAAPVEAAALPPLPHTPGSRPPRGTKPER